MEKQCLSSTSSSLTPQYKYDVFLSFRGKDTRKGFTDHLYAALVENNGINTFRDEEGLQRGESITLELVEAIEKSRFAVIVLSKNYANSTWCLNELARIVECRKEKGLTVFPIFYNVTSSDVRCQTGDFEEAFVKHKEHFKENMEKVDRWISALTQVANLSGFPVNDRYEREVINKIVREISRLLYESRKSPKVITKDIVGIKSQLEKLSLYLKYSNDVRLIGIWGMVGIGKTTLAEALYETYYNEFDSCSFIANVKGSITDRRDLTEVRRRLLSDICNDKNIPVEDEKIKNSLSSKKVLLVLDDVNDFITNRLKDLVKWDWFGPGSRIVITSRDKRLLKTILKVHEIHECEKLNDQDALQLFCWKAFEKDQPKEDYENLSRDIVSYASGLPLALDRWGSSLFDRGKSHWEDELKRLQKRLEETIFEELKRSYDELRYPSEKELFIYIACFLNGKNEDLVKGTLKGLRGVYPSGMDVLEEKSLITISDADRTVRVHNLLQQMGWEILHKQPFEERMGHKFRDDIVDALTTNMGTTAIKIINQESTREEVTNCMCDCEAFSKMRKLLFLNIRNLCFQHDIG